MNRPDFRVLAFAITLCALQFWKVEICSAQATTETAGSKIIGRVLSAETGEPLGYANVSVYKTNPAAGDTLGSPFGGANTAQDGSYRVACPAGTYRLVVGYVGYNQQKISGVEVGPDAVATVDVSLYSTAMEIEEIEITARADRATEQAILTKQKRSSSVSDGISTQQIKKTPDSNAADVLKRVTGVSTVGGKYIYVRGLGERYSATQVNGSTISSPEPNKKVVPLDIFAAGLLENVVIQKTYTPDQPGEFAGGVVNLSTRDFPGQRLWELSVSTGLGTEAASNDFRSYAGGGTDFLGFDDGARALPDLVEKLAGHKLVEQRGMFDPPSKGFSSDTLAMIGQSFHDDWETETGKRPLSNMGLAASYGDEIQVLGEPLGFLGSVSYTNTSSYNDAVLTTYENAGEDVRSSYDTATSESASLWGAIVNTSYRFNPFHTLNVRTMYNRSAEDEVRVANGFTTDTNRNMETTRYQFVERGIFTSSLGMNHFVSPLFGATVDWKVTYANAERNEPDRRQLAYEEIGDIIVIDEEPVDTVYSYQLTNRLRPQREFGEMTEDDRGYEAALSVPFRQWSSLEAKVKTGFQIKNRDRSFSWRRFAYELPSLTGTGVDRDSVFAQPADDLLTVENIGGPNDRTRQFWLRENTGDKDSYLASQDVDALYMMFDLPLTSRLRTVFGARAENATMTNDTYNQFTGVQSSEAKLDNDDVLPSLNLIYSLNDASNLRAAFSKTVSRPDLRELSDFYLEDVVTLISEVGNPELKRALITNYDLRWETYPGTQEIFAVSAFYKEFEDAIERSVLLGSAPVIKPVNAKSASLYGAEFESRFGLGRLRPGLSSISATANLTVVESEAELDESTGVQYSSKRPLEGQSPYVVNAGFYYSSDDGKTNGSILYNRFGRRLSRVGLLETPDIYEESRGALDLQVARSFRTFRLKLTAKNLTDEESRFAHDGAGVTSLSKNGRAFAVSISTGS